jgi:flagellin-specific chaperone FliS
MSIIDTLITNRQNGAKYNHTDLNRVENAFEYLQNRLNNEFGFNITLTIKKDWVRQDLGQMGAQTLIEQYRQNVITIRSALTLPAGIAETPASMRFITAEQANDIEKILQAVDDILNKIPSAYCHAGMIFAGQGGLRT